MPKKPVAHVEELSEEESKSKEVHELNVESVHFAAAKVKFIISPHSGSILSDPEPHIELADTVEKKARDIFNSIEESCGCSGKIPREKIVDMLGHCGYALNKDILRDVVLKKCLVEEVDERGWLTFLEKFQAPAYFYGQRLRKYCGRGQLEEIGELLVRGCEVNSGDGEGLTPLHYAAELNRSDVIQLLASVTGNHLRVDIQDKYGWTPLHSATHHGSNDCVDTLIKLGASLSIRDNIGKTPLHLAAAQVVSMSYARS